jgi:hypothetical protein
MTAPEIFSIIKDVVLASAAVITAVVAYTGIEKWKKELRGKADFDVARELAKSMYYLRNEIQYCRSPFYSMPEFPEGYQGSVGSHTPEEEGQAWAHLFANRWERVGDAIEDFETATLEAEALWGGGIRDKTDNLRKLVAELRSSIEAVISDKYSGGENFKDRQFSKQMRANVAATSSEENSLSKHFETAISDLESALRPHLSRS